MLTGVFDVTREVRCGLFVTGSGTLTFLGRLLRRLSTRSSAFTLTKSTTEYVRVSDILPCPPEIMKCINRKSNPETSKADNNDKE